MKHGFSPPSGCRLAMLAWAALMISAAPVAADLFTDYDHRPERDFLLPADLSNSQGGTLLDNLPDGRLVMVTTRESAPYTTDGVELRIETTAGSRNFRYVGDLPLPSGTGSDSNWFNPGAFLTVSQGAGNPRIALGNANFSLAVFTANQLDGLPTLAAPAAAPLAITWFDNLGAALSVDGNFVAAAAWRDDTHLAVASGVSDSSRSQLHMLDITSPPAALVAALVIDNAPPGTGGVAFDATGDFAYFGVGYGADVGDIRRFATSGWPATQNFAGGALLTTLLSAGWLQFDVEQNLLVGGGDTFGGSGQFNYFAIENPLGQQRLFDPDTLSAFNAYNLAYNPVTGEILAWDNFSSSPRQVYVFAAEAEAEAVSEPATVTLLGLGAVMVVGTAVLRRTRRPGRLANCRWCCK